MKNKKPQWVSSFVDQEQYKLSQAELMQKKISLISKHRMEAKDQWQTVQNKLKNNIIDEDTQKVQIYPNKIYETALSAKGLSNSTNKRKNLTQMIEWERNQQSMQKSDVLDQAKSLLDMTQNLDKENTFIDKVKNDLESAKTLVAKAQRSKQPDRILRSIERSQKTEQVEIKQQAKKDYDFIGLKNLDNVINFLENTLTIEQPQSKIQQSSENQVEFIPIQKCQTNDLIEIPKIEKQCESPVYFNQDSWQPQKQIQSNQIKQDFEYDYENRKPIQEFGNPFQNSIINDAKQKEKQKELEQKLVIENLPKIQMNKNELSFDDNIDQLKQMLELTRMELNQMNLHDPSFLESDQGKEQVIPIRSFDVKQMHQKYKNKNTFDIKDHFA